MEPRQSGTDGTEQTTAGGANWMFPALLLAVLIALGAYAKWSPQPVVQPTHKSASSLQPSPQPTGETVGLSIDFGNGAQKNFSALAWREGMTVADLLEAARKYQPGIEFTQVGTGASGFLSSLDGVANEGANGRNWLYQVDNRHAHASFCLEKIEPGMNILWTFTDELYNDESTEK